MGILYILATPIGNLQDLSLRTIDVLNKVEIIACEDTRHTGLLLKHIQGLRNVILNKAKDPMGFFSFQPQNDKKTLLSYYEQNEFKRIPQILNALHNGISVALVSDAGTPTISDPGFKLVRECIGQGIKVESIPGPSSVISALVVSGLPTDKFLFLGFPPKKPGHRKSMFEKVKSANEFVKSTVIFFESPHHLLRTLEDLKEVFGDIDIVICRELTKIYEEVRREKLSEAISHFIKVVPKGEFVILLQNARART